MAQKHQFQTALSKWADTSVGLYREQSFLAGNISLFSTSFICGDRMCDMEAIK